MRALLLALSFLTRYPLGSGLEPKRGDFGKATGYFPLAGLFVGLDLLMLRYVFMMDSNGLHYPIWSFLLLAYWIWSCSSLHLDGMADTCDALASRAEGKDFLRVLHDPRIGTFGALALGLSLLARFAYLRYLPMQFIWFLPLPLITSRTLGALLCQSRPYAGKEGSLSSLFVSEAHHADANKALTFAFASFLALAAASVYLGAAEPWDMARALGACGLGMLCGWTAFQIPRFRLGGVSGDLVGYAQEICELCCCLALFLLLVHENP